MLQTPWRSTRVAGVFGSVATGEDARPPFWIERSHFSPLLESGKGLGATGPSNLPLISFLPYRLQITSCPICSSLQLWNDGPADGLERWPHDRSRPAGLCRPAER